MGFRLLFFRVGQAVLLAFVITAMHLFTAFSQAQIKDVPRGIKPREYAKQLPDVITQQRPPSNQVKRRKSASYVAKSLKGTIDANGVDIGVTFWRLGKGKNGEPERIAERRELPRRVATDTAFADGEFMQIGIEASLNAYIYIINREQYSDGGYSEPYLIFPSATDLGRNDKLYAGRIVLIPEDPDYFELKLLGTDNSKKVAEVYTFILTPQPLTNLPPLKPKEPNRKIDAQLFNRWEQDWSKKAWRFDLKGGDGLPMTNDERIATRVDGDLLTQNSMLPQTVYHVASRSGNPFSFTVAVPVRK